MNRGVIRAQTRGACERAKATRMDFIMKSDGVNRSSVDGLERR